MRHEFEEYYGLEGQAYLEGFYQLYRFLSDEATTYDQIEMLARCSVLHFPSILAILAVGLRYRSMTPTV